jgi:hypothetical protein
VTTGQAASPGWVRRDAEPFQPGNTAAVTHGARSPRIIEAKAAEVHTELLEVAPWLDRDEFLPAVVRYLQACAREQLLHEHITRLSADDGPGAVSSRTWEQATAAARLAAKLGQDLGLDPIGHARLRAVAGAAEVTAITLADLQATGREIMARRTAIDADAEPTEGTDDG